ncbi:MAG: hypothetical protein E6Q89_00635 [Bacteroidia bacterium]|nr:MAG: hypothetical protein E6Q89_00635 [Bacteroidia bacterium]
MFKICKHCGDEFNINSLEKKRIGGLINECPDCVEENGGDLSPPKYLGVQSGDGKMASISLLSFKDEKSRSSYARAWKNNSGQNKGKSCQLGRHLTSMSGMKFKLVGENRGNENHKGKS